MDDFCLKHQHCLFNLKFDSQTGSNVPYWMVVLTFFLFLDQKKLFWANSVQNTKVVCKCWNLVPRLILMYWIQWWCQLFLFNLRNTLFGNFGLKNRNCLLKLKFSIYINSNVLSMMVVFLFFLTAQKMKYSGLGHIYWRNP